MPTVCPSRASRTDLLELNFQYRSCQQCKLSAFRKRPFEGVGNPNSPVVFVLDRFSPAEIASQRFLVGTEYADVLGAIGEYMGKNMDEYWYTPVVLCPTTLMPGHDERPMEVTPLPRRKETTACSGRLRDEIACIEPELVIACGTPALHALFPRNTPTLQYNVGEIREAPFQGEIVEYTVPVLLAHSLHALFTRQTEIEEGGLWEKTMRQMHLAINHAEYLRGIRRNP